MGYVGIAGIYFRWYQMDKNKIFYSMSKERYEEIFKKRSTKAVKMEVQDDSKRTVRQRRR